MSGWQDGRMEDGWSEELADQRADEPRMVVRRADGIVAVLRRVLDEDDLDRYDAEELSEAPKDPQWGIQWDQSEVFAWLKEGLARSVAYIERDDGRIAAIGLAWEPDDDAWTAIGRCYPTAEEMMGEDVQLLPDDREYAPDVRFALGDDDGLAVWLAETFYSCGYVRRALRPGVVVEARRSDGIAVVTWTVDGQARRVQTIALNRGDFERIAVGHDPEAEQWEDGNGNLVCVENAQVGTE